MSLMRRSGYPLFKRSQSRDSLLIFGVNSTNIWIELKSKRRGNFTPTHWESVAKMERVEYTEADLNWNTDGDKLIQYYQDEMIWWILRVTYVLIF